MTDIGRQRIGLPAAPAANPRKLDDAQEVVHSAIQDSAAGRLRLTDAERALLNILDDFSEEKARLEGTQRAVLNILEDLDAERTETRKAQAALKELNATLEQRVVERTAELRRANEELRKEISDRKQAEERLRANQELLRAVTDNTVDAIYVKDARSRWLMANPALLKIVGKPLKDVLGKTDAEIYADPAIAAAILANDAQILERGDPAVFEERAQTPEGSRLFLSTKAPRRDAQGKVIGLVGISRDITERKLAQEALLRSEKLAATGRLAATMAHEINNPLAAVMNSIYLALRDPTLEKQTREYLSTAEQELIRVANLTRQTLAFYHETSPAQSASVEAIVNDVLRTFGHKLRAKRILVTKEIAAQVHVTAVVGEFRQVLSNIVANAIDALPAGGNLRVRAHHVAPHSGSQARVMMTIADNGAGIAAELRKCVFDPFFTTKKEFGTGLGLWVTRELLRKNGGSIRMRSRPGVGTVFSIFLPIPMAAAAALR